jgi:ferredoxin-fold anticodon binding domain-containing protein
MDLDFELENIRFASDDELQEYYGRWLNRRHVQKEVIISKAGQVSKEEIDLERLNLYDIETLIMHIEERLNDRLEF